MLKKQTLVFLSTFAVVALWSVAAFAQDVGAADNVFTTYGFIGLGAGLVLGLTGIGAALGMGKAGASALEGIARNPGAQSKIFTPLIVTLALIEAIAIYGLLIAFLFWLQFQLPGSYEQLMELVQAAN